MARVDVDQLLSGLWQFPPKILSEQDLKIVCDQVRLLLLQENNVEEINAPVTICGDVHGQFFDLLQLLEISDDGQNTFVFLGDYVDRGCNSVESLELLLLLKLKWPSRFILLRGNHESRQVTTVYGFYDECVRKYGNANPWRYCTEVFDCLTLAAVISDSIFCVHGGLSPTLKLLDQLRLINRLQEIPHAGSFGDIVWSDPDDIESWGVNPRGAGWLFGGPVTKKFNELNGLDLVARAHQLAMDGFKYMFKENSLVTVWSAPNYCYRCGNVAAVMQVDEQLRRRMLIFKQAQALKDGSHDVTPYFV